MLDDRSVGIKAEDIDAGAFLATPVQVAHMHRGQIAVDRDALELARDAGLLDIWPAHQSRIQVGLTLVEDFLVNCAEHVPDVISVSILGLTVRRAQPAFRLGPTVFLSDTRESRRRIPPCVDALVRQVHLLQKCFEARIAVQAIEQQVDFDL